MWDPCNENEKGDLKKEQIKNAKRRHGGKTSKSPTHETGYCIAIKASLRSKKLEKSEKEKEKQEKKQDCWGHWMHLPQSLKLTCIRDTWNKNQERALKIKNLVKRSQIGETIKSPTHKLGHSIASNVFLK